MEVSPESNGLRQAYTQPRSPLPAACLHQFLFCRLMSHRLGGWLVTSGDGFSTDSLMFHVFHSGLPLFCGLFQRRGWATCLSSGGT